MQQDDRRSVRCADAPLPDGGQDEAIVRRRGIDTRRGAEPGCLACAGVRVAHSSLGMPVDADAAEAHRLRDDAQRDRIHDPIEGAPVGSKPIEVLAVRAAVYLGVVRDAAIPGRDLQLDAQHIPDDLELVYELQIDHLGVALLALAFKFIPGKILRQRGLVPALIGYDAH